MYLVTGGTGLIGSHLLMSLVKKDALVRALFRSPESIEKVKKVFSYYDIPKSQVIEKIEWIQGDITDITSLADAIKNVTHVYHCAALISFDPRDYKKLVKTNVEGTKNIVEICKANGVEKLCHVSSIATLGPSPKGKPINEENEWNDKNASVYAVTKRAAELEVWRGIQEGLSAAIVNPGVVLGPGFWKSGSGWFFYLTAKQQKKTMPGGTGFISVSDVIDAMEYLMRSDISNERFILTEENTTYLDIMQRIAKVMQVKAPKHCYSTVEIELFWRLDWLRTYLFGRKRILSKNVARTIHHFDQYDNKKIKEVLGQDLNDLNETIDFTSRCFLEDFPELL